MKQEKEILTTKDLENIFQVCHKTIWNWRFKNNPRLPYFYLSGNPDKPPVRFHLDKVRKWAEKADKEIYLPMYE